MATLLDYALTSVADVKELLGIDSGDSSKNNLIIRRINQATEMIERYTGRRFKSSNYTEYYDGSYTDVLVLNQRPVTEISVLSARDTALNDDDFSVIDTSDYFINSNAGVIEAISGFYGGWDRWKVEYTAGYTNIPADIQEAAASLAAYLVQNGTTGQGVKRMTEGSRSVEYHESQSSSLISDLGLDDILAPHTNTVI